MLLGFKYTYTYTPDANDVFVATFPKSGTHWMMQLALQLLKQGRAEFRNIYDEIPWYEIGSPGQACIWDKVGPRVVKSHMPWSHLPYSEEAKYIFVHRDPKEVFVSAWYFIKHLVPGVELRRVLDAFLYEGCFPGHLTWSEQTASYLNQADKANVLNVTFNDMKSNLQAVVRVVAAFLGIICSEDVISRVTCLASFDYMKANEWRFNLVDRVDLGSVVRARSSDVHIVLTDAQCAEIDTVCSSGLLGFGVDRYDQITQRGSYES